MNIQSPSNGKSDKKGNPAPYYIVAVPQKEIKEKSVIECDKQKAGKGISAYDVYANGMPFNIEVGNYNFVEVDGKIQRVGENGVKYPPISKEKFEKIKKEREAKLLTKKQDTNKNTDNERI